MDETSARRRHEYISLFYDLDQRRMVFATSGKDAGSVAASAISSTIITDLWTLAKRAGQYHSL